GEREIGDDGADRDKECADVTARSRPLAGVDPRLGRAAPHTVHDENQRACDETAGDKPRKQRRTDVLSSHLGKRRNVHENRDTEDKQDCAEDRVVEFHPLSSSRATRETCFSAVIPSRAQRVLSEAKELLLVRAVGAPEILRRCAPQDDESVSNRCDASRLALGRIRHLAMPRDFITVPISASPFAMYFAKASSAAHVAPKPRCVRKS